MDSVMVKNDREEKLKLSALWWYKTIKKNFIELAEVSEWGRLPLPRLSLSGDQAEKRRFSV